jgi:diguanylate cyclase (GGDEF)-like protein
MKENLLEQLRFCTNLPSLPAVALKIIDLAGKADTNLTQINHYISLDPVLAAKIVKTANSPLYKSRHPISNISQAVSMLGTHGVMTVALSFSLMDSLMKHSREKLDLASSSVFWRRSITSALASRALGKRLGMTMLDDLFLAGLLQDIGILALYAILPDTYPSIFSSAANHDALFKTECETFGIGHDELGAALLERWKLPTYISNACRYSQNVLKNPSRIGINECVATSGYVADYFLAPGEKEKVTVVIDTARAYLDLDEHALIEVLEDMKDELHHVEDLFEISILDPVHLSSIVDEARELLTMRTLIKVRELEDKIQHDGLTGAHNRAYFNDTFQCEFLLSSQQGLPLSLAMIDIDNFKTVNDTYGHIAGDGVLVAVVKAISGQIRQTDILCRYGGEEFALILPGTPLAASRAILTRVKDSIAAIAYKLDTSHTIHITASIGLAVNMDKEKSFDTYRDMLEAADCALYAAKHGGRNRITEWNPALVSPIKTQP